jgi:hypothetical protein
MIDFVHVRMGSDIGYGGLGLAGRWFAMARLFASVIVRLESARR